MSDSSAQADIVLVGHALFGAMIFGGLVLAVAGLLLRWSWTQSNGWRVPHLVVTVCLFIRSQCGLPCPLSVWEDYLRHAAVNTQDTTPGQSILRLLAFRNLDDPTFGRAMAGFTLVTLTLFLGQRIFETRWGALSSSQRLRERKREDL